MRVFFSVGEPSGDLHGANLVKRLKENGIQCVGYGGPRMQEAGCQLLEDLTQYAVMFLTALKFIPKLWKLYRSTDQFFAKEKIDAVVLIDFPGFNWWIAKAAKRNGIPVYYYGVPQMWAWMPGRVKKLKRLVDHVICKLPFEAPWFSQRGVKAHYVGHPYFDELVNRKLDPEFLAEYDHPTRPLITLLPGSRNQEVKNNLPWLVESAIRIKQQVPDASVAVACFNYHHSEAVREYLAQADLPFDVFVKRTPELIELSTICLACSGSVSLELMYHHKPSIVVYRLSRIQAAFKWLALTCRFITLVNLLAVDDINRSKNKPHDATKPNQEIPFPEFPWVNNPSIPIADLAISWLKNPSELERRRAQLRDLSTRFGQAGATQRAATFILEQLQPIPSKAKMKSEPFAAAAYYRQNNDAATEPAIALNGTHNGIDLDQPIHEEAYDEFEDDWSSAAAAAYQVQKLSPQPLESDLATTPNPERLAAITRPQFTLPKFTLPKSTTKAPTTTTEPHSDSKRRVA